MYAYLAYQPIVNQFRQVTGYELFYRDGSGNAARIANPAAADNATRKVISDAFSLFDFQNETSGFFIVNFTRNLILDDFVRNADPARVIVQLTGNTKMDEALESKLLALRNAGYQIALKNYAGQSHLRNYLSLFNVIRVDCKRTNSVFWKEVVRKRGVPNTLFMADRIERERDFDDARSMDYKLFQGYYFGRPKLEQRKIPPLIETPYGQILKTLLYVSSANDSENQWWTQCARIIESDLTLSYLFPREAASLPPPSKTHYARSHAMETHNVIYRMGPHQLRRWTCLAFMRQRNSSGDDNLPRRAYQRGVFMDELAKRSALNVDVPSGNAFLLGVFSLLRKVTGASPQYLLQGLQLPGALLDALYGTADNDYARLLQYVTRYESPNADPDPADIRSDLSEADIDRIYRLCMTDADAAVERMDTPV